MSDGTIQIAPDSTGKKIATSEITRNNGDVVEIQHVVISDPRIPISQVSVTPNGELIVNAEIFSKILIELKRIAMLLEILSDREIPVEIFK